MAYEGKWSMFYANAPREAGISWLPLDLLLVFRPREGTDDE